MHLQRILVLCGGVGIVASAAVFPWLNVPLLELLVSGGGWGWLAGALGGVAIAAAFVGNRPSPLKKPALIAVAASGLAAAALGVFLIIHVKDSVKSLGGAVGGKGIGAAMAGDLLGGAVSAGWGLYAMVVCGVATAGMAVIFRKTLAPSR